MHKKREPIHPIKISEFEKVVFFTGAGMSKESGVPTYRGAGGIWGSYDPGEVACQDAFEKKPEKVLKFHELRRAMVLECQPNSAHYKIAEWETQARDFWIVTQNIDGLHQRAGSHHVIELHGSLWRLRCPECGILEDLHKKYQHYNCEKCGHWLRPDIIWFGDVLDSDTLDLAVAKIKNCDLLVSIGTSASVWPAATLPEIARRNGAYCIEINPDETGHSPMYQKSIRATATQALQDHFK